MYPECIGNLALVRGLVLWCVTRRVYGDPPGGGIPLGRRTPREGLRR